MLKSEREVRIKQKPSAAILFLDGVSVTLCVSMNKGDKG